MGILKLDLKATPMGFVGAIGLCVAALSGCSTKASADAAAEAQAAKVEQAAPQITKVNQIASDVRDEFTTEGKATKTIETPWGPREIYDPLQDPDVIDAFVWVKEQNYSNIADLFAANSRYEYSNENIELLFLAREIHHLDVMRIGCKNLISYECGATRRGNVNLASKCLGMSIIGRQRQLCEGASYQKILRSRPNGCMIDIDDKETHPNIYYQLVNENALGSPNILAPNNLKDQLGIFYDYKCQKW